MSILDNCRDEDVELILSLAKELGADWKARHNPNEGTAAYLRLSAIAKDGIIDEKTVAENI